MDGIYDLGGVAGFGRIEVEENEPLFHEEWEHFTYCSAFIAGTLPNGFNIDEFRHAVERIEPRQYLNSSYYERILTASASLFVEKGILTQDELEAKAGGAFPLALPVADTAGEHIPSASNTFAVGDKVRVLDLRATGHTRSPKYTRGKQGEVVHITPPFNFPDAAAHGKERFEEPTYHVRFSGEELWDSGTEPNTSVIVQLWQSYLEAV